MQSSIPTTTIHLSGKSGEPLKSSLFKVSSFRHFPNDAGKGQNSLFLQLNSGFRSKNGMTLSRRYSRFRTTNTIV